MQTLSAESKYHELGFQIELIERVILFKQFSGTVINVTPASNTITVNGDADSWGIFAGNIIICPNQSFQDEYTVSSFSYDGVSDTTSIIVTTEPPTNWMGYYVAVKDDITSILTREGVQGVESKIEGSELDEFDSGYLDVVLDNSEEYFRSRGKTGIFDYGDVYWGMYLLKFRSMPDGLLNYFAGLVDIGDTEPDLYDKTINVRIYGHTYELNRFPAYTVCDKNGADFLKIRGLELISFTPTDNTQEGIKTVSYNPFAKSRMEGVKINSVSQDTTAGIKRFEYKYPNWFRWDNGEWVRVAGVNDTDNNSGTLRMYAKGGTGAFKWVEVSFGSESGLSQFPDDDEEIWVEVKNDYTKESTGEVDRQGRPTMSYDGGEEIYLTSHFTHVLSYDSSATTFVDISDSANNPKRKREFSSIYVLRDTDDELILSCSDRFFGMSIVLRHAFTTSDLSFYYSTGGTAVAAWSGDAMSFGNDAFIDGTNGFTKNGNIYWGNLDKWKPNYLLTHANGLGAKGYMIRIVRNSATGTCDLVEIRKMLRLIGQDGDFIEFNIEQDKLGTEPLEDEFIIFKNSSGTWEYGTWFYGCAMKWFLDKALDAAKYPELKRYLTTTRVIRNNPIINWWGRTPRFNNIEEPTAMCIDFANQVAYIAFSDEVWKSDFTGRWERYLFDIMPSTIDAGTVQGKSAIRKMWIQNGDQMCFIMTYFQDDGNVFACFGYIHLLVYDMTNETWSDRYVDASTDYVIVNGYGTYGAYLGQPTYRRGAPAVLWETYEGGRYIKHANRGFGQWYNPDRPDELKYCGENWCIPFPQKAWFAGLQVSENLYDPLYATDIQVTVLVNSCSGTLDDGYAPNGGNFADWWMHVTVERMGIISSLPLNSDLPQRPVFTNPPGFYAGIYREDWSLSSLASRILHPPYQEDFHMLTDYGNPTLGNMVVDTQGRVFWFFKNVMEPVPLQYTRYLYQKFISMVGIGSGTAMCGWRDNGMVPYCAITDPTDTFFLFAFTAWHEESLSQEISYSYLTKHTKFGDSERIEPWVYVEVNTVDETSTANTDPFSPITTKLTANDQYVYFGASHKFSNVYLNTSGGSCDWLIEFWDGSAWAPVLYPYHDFIEAVGLLSWTMPRGWEKNTVSANNAYYIRAKVQGKTGGDITLETCSQLDAVMWDSEFDNAGDFDSHMIVNMCFDSHGDLHGCFFNRKSDYADDMPFQWKHFTLDIGTGELYADLTDIIVSDGYTYDGTFIFKDFVADPNDSHSVFCMAENRRYKDAAAKLLRCSYNPASNKTTITQLTIPYASEWQSRLPLQANEKSVFGMTGPTTNGLWEYSTDFYPRLELCKFNESETIYDVLKYIAQYINSFLFIHSDRTVRFVKRDTYTGETNLVWNKNMVQGEPTFRYWEFTVDSVSVKYESQVDDSIKGTRKLGFDGWQKKTMSIDNPLIQNVHSAQMVVEDLYEYFRHMRYHVKDISITPMIELECTDRFNVLMHRRILEFDPEIYFLITSIKFGGDKSVKIEGVEIIPGSSNS